MLQHREQTRAHLAVTGCDQAPDYIYLASQLIDRCLTERNPERQAVTRGRPAAGSCKRPLAHSPLGQSRDAGPRKRVGRLFTSELATRHYTRWMRRQVPRSGRSLNPHLRCIRRRRWRMALSTLDPGTRTTTRHCTRWMRRQANRNGRSLSPRQRCARRRQWLMTLSMSGPTTRRCTRWMRRRANESGASPSATCSPRRWWLITPSTSDQTACTRWMRRRANRSGYSLTSPPGGGRRRRCTKARSTSGRGRQRCTR